MTKQLRVRIVQIVVRIVQSVLHAEQRLEWLLTDAQHAVGIEILYLMRDTSRGNNMEEEDIREGLSQMYDSMQQLHDIGHIFAVEFVKINPDWKELDTHGYVEYFLREGI